MSANLHLAPAPDALKACTNCGSGLVDVFCAACGEKQPDHHDLTLGHFLHELVHELVHLDSKLFGTLRTLVTKPGQLTVDYFAGRKKRFIAPLRLFLVLFALQLVAFTLNSRTAMYSVEGMVTMDTSAALQNAITGMAKEAKLERQAFIELVDQKWRSNMSVFQLGNVILFALGLKLLFIRRDRTFGEHLVFCTHVLAFSYLYSLACWPIYFFHGIRPSALMYSLSFVSTVVLMTYLFFALRRYYGQSKRKTFVKTFFAYGSMLFAAMMMMYGTMIAAAVAVIVSHR
ncbi:MAG TPA: DUF3667 domain-containing protein [Thermoanaerobaculia bacterium]|jgi:hypothetical protein